MQNDLDICFSDEAFIESVKWAVDEMYFVWSIQNRKGKQAKHQKGINGAYQGGDLSIEGHPDRELRAAGDTWEERHTLSNRRDQLVNRDLVRSKTRFILLRNYEVLPPTSCLDQVEAIVQLRQASLVELARLHVFGRHILHYPLLPKPNHPFSKVYFGDKLVILGAFPARTLWAAEDLISLFSHVASNRVHSLKNCSRSI